MKMIFRAVFIVALWGIATVAAGADDVFLLPVERTVYEVDASGKSWNEAGALPVSVTAASQMWELAFRRAGWYFVREIPLDFATGKHLQVWSKGEKKLILCLWGAAPGESQDMWGIMNRTKQ